jgi:hypothetical protein
MDTVGDRWWPVLGAVYFVTAVKRVRGMRLVGKVKRVPVKAPAVRAAPAVVSRAAALPAGRKDVPTELES